MGRVSSSGDRMNIEVRQPDGRASRLKAATHRAHERLDGSIMAARPFESRERYGLFLQVQHAFHREIDVLYSDPGLERLLPDLAGRRRLSDIECDLDDLGLAPSPTNPTVFEGSVDIPTALGWLYVAEGSNLGAAFLLKAAAGLGLSADFGARHLAAAPEGRGLHWRTFTAALDALDLDDGADERVIAGAQSAFLRVQDWVDRLFPPPPSK